MVLGEINPAAKAAVPVLISALQDENEDVRYRTDEAPGTIGIDAEDRLYRLRCVCQAGVGPLKNSVVPIIVL